MLKGINAPLKTVRYKVITHIVSLLIDEMLWILTWGWYQLILSILITWILFVCVGRIKTLKALVITTTSYVCAITVYFLIVAGLFIAYFQWKFVPGNSPSVLNAPAASFTLGLIYSVLQTIFFYSIDKWNRFSYARLSLLALVSNMTAAFISSLFVSFVL